MNISTCEITTNCWHPTLPYWPAPPSFCSRYISMLEPFSYGTSEKASSGSTPFSSGTRWVYGWCMWLICQHQLSSNSFSFLHNSLHNSTTNSCKRWWREITVIISIIIYIFSGVNQIAAITVVSGGAFWWTLTRCCECFRGELLTMGRYRNLSSCNSFYISIPSWVIIT